jgi:Uma2 family endonuclease
MAVPQRVPNLTRAEYLAKERAASYRSEYFDGETFAMAGSSPRHSLIKVNEDLLVSQEEPKIERFLRNDDGTWTLTEASGLDSTLPLPAPGIEIALREVYDKADFSPPPAARRRVADRCRSQVTLADRGTASHPIAAGVDAGSAVRSRNAS